MTNQRLRTDYRIDGNFVIHRVCDSCFAEWDAPAIANYQPLCNDCMAVLQIKMSDYVVCGPCQCPKCRLARVIADNLETKWTDPNLDRNPDLFPGQLVKVINGIFWGAVAVAAILGSWAILSR